MDDLDNDIVIPAEDQDEIPPPSAPLDDEHTAVEAAAVGDTDTMAKKSKAPKARKTAPARKAKPARAPKPNTMRSGKKGLLIVTTQSLPVLVKALAMFVKDEAANTAADRELAAALLARAKTRL